MILTNEPPNAGPDPLKVQNQVAAGDMSEAFVRLDRCGADAELIDLAKKCLAPEAEQRLPDAGAVAREVRRYLDTVQERLRQAELERTAAEAREKEAKLKVCAERRARRMTIGLAAARGGGIMASTLFAIDANSQKEQVRGQKKEVQRKNEEVQRKNKELGQTNEQLEANVIRGWQSLLAQRVDDRLTAPEMVALEDMAQHRQDPLLERFYKDTTARPELSMLRGRISYVWQAGVGLDQEKRKEVEKLLLPALCAQGLDAKRREELALAAADLGGLSPEPAEALATVEALTLAMAEMGPWVPEDGERLASALATVTNRLEPAKAAEVLLQAMKQTKQAAVLRELAQVLSRVTSRLDPQTAKGFCEAGADLLLKAEPSPDGLGLMYDSDRRWLAYGMIALAPRMAPRGRPRLRDGRRSAQQEGGETAHLLRHAMSGRKYLG